MNRIIHKGMVIPLALLAVSACSKITQENYDKIEMGMTHPDVEMVLGKADACEKTVGTYSCTWGDPDNKFIKINFIGGRAVVFLHQGLDKS